MTARDRILVAFRELVLSVPFDEFRTHDVIRRADVARSTFYAHFKDRNDLLLASLGPILTVLSATCRGDVEHGALIRTLEHVWENRAIGRVFFRAPISARLAREMVRMLREYEIHSSRTHFLVNGLLGTLGAWTGGELALTPPELSEVLLQLTAMPEETRDVGGLSVVRPAR